MKFNLPKKTLNTFVLTKVAPGSDEKINKAVNALFEDPSTYLRLPGESKVHFVVGKKLCGPRYDNEEQVIPYSIVGNPKIFRHRNLNANMSRTSSISKYTIKEQRDTQNSNIISDNEINAIFSRCRDNIDSNTDRTNEFLSTIPNTMNDKVKKPLMLQQKNLEIHSHNNYTENKIVEKIKKKLYKNQKDKKNEKELLMCKSDTFRMKKEKMEFIQNTEDINYRYGRFNWIMSLRRPKHFVGVRRGYVNLGNEENPIWSVIREKLPIITETVINPSWPASERMNETHSTLDMYVKTTPSLFGYVSKTMGMSDLEVKGKDLLKAEEENVKLLRGKKKLIHLKYDRDSIKDLNICENWR